MKETYTEVPTYVFLGFLEGGKTTFIQGTLEDRRFVDGEKTLLLVCEEGEAEYDKERFASKDKDDVVIEKSKVLLLGPKGTGKAMLA